MTIQSVVYALVLFGVPLQAMRGAEEDVQVPLLQKLAAAKCLLELSEAPTTPNQLRKCFRQGHVVAPFGTRIYLKNVIEERSPGTFERLASTWRSDDGAFHDPHNLWLLSARWHQDENPRGGRNVRGFHVYEPDHLSEETGGDGAGAAGAGVGPTDIGAGSRAAAAEPESDNDIVWVVIHGVGQRSDASFYNDEDVEKQSYRDMKFLAAWYARYRKKKLRLFSYRWSGKAEQESWLEAANGLHQILQLQPYNGSEVVLCGAERGCNIASVYTQLIDEERAVELLLYLGAIKQKYKNDPTRWIEPLHFKKLRYLFGRDAEIEDDRVRVPAGETNWPMWTRLSGSVGATLTIASYVIPHAKGLWFLKHLKEVEKVAKLGRIAQASFYGGMSAGGVAALTRNEAKKQENKFKGKDHFPAVEKASVLGLNCIYNSVSLGRNELLRMVPFLASVLREVDSDAFDFTGGAYLSDFEVDERLDERGAGQCKLLLSRRVIAFPKDDPAGEFEEQQAEVLERGMSDQELERMFFSGRIAPGSLPRGIFALLRILRNGVDNARARLILFEGPPGAGKTMITEQLAGALEAPFLYRDTAALLTKMQGSGSKSVKDAFEKIVKLQKKRKSKYAILFFDEFDALGNREDFAGGCHPGPQNAILSFCQELDGIDKKPNLLVFAATNYPDRLDPALCSRVFHNIRVALPTKKQRASIIKFHCLKKGFFGRGVSCERLASMTHGMSGRALEHLVDKILVGGGSSRITEADFVTEIENMKAVDVRRRRRQLWQKLQSRGGAGPA